MLLKNPNVFLFPLNWQPTKRGEKGKTFEKFSKIFTTPLTYTREFRTACTTQKQHNLQIVYYSCLYYICQFTMLLSKPNYKAPHLIATGNAVWQGTFSKIQSMFTISPHIKALVTCHLPRQFERIVRNIFIYNHTADREFWNPFANICKISIPNSLGKSKTAPPFPKITARKQKEKAVT